jgi:hypothetical protein
VSPLESASAGLPGGSHERAEQRAEENREELEALAAAAPQGRSRGARAGAWEKASSYSDGPTPCTRA